jgi:ADP-sugar diphosphatase
VLPGICFLRGSAVSILVALFCRTEEDAKDENAPSTTQCYTLLVEQARVPVGGVATLELPAGMMDSNHAQTVAGLAVQEMQEECGLHIQPSELHDLTELAGLSDGLAPSPGGCDERIRYLYMEKIVTVAQLEQMRERLTGLREHGEVLVLKVVPMDDVWKVSGDQKAIM